MQAPAATRLIEGGGPRRGAENLACESEDTGGQWPVDHPGDLLASAVGGWLRFLDDGRIKIGSNRVEHNMPPIALNKKNAVFAGCDEGGGTAREAETHEHGPRCTWQ